MFFKLRPYVESDFTKQLKNYVYDIVGFMQEVYKQLPCGLPEYIYQEALATILEENHIDPHKEFIYHPTFHGKELKSYLRMDMMFERERGNIIIECKARESIGERERHQLFSYMIGTTFPIGILVNFGTYPQASIEKYYLDSNNNTITPF